MAAEIAGITPCRLGNLGPVIAAILAAPVWIADGPLIVGVGFTVTVAVAIVRLLA